MTHPRCVFSCRYIFSKSFIHNIQDETKQATCFGWLSHQQAFFENKASCVNIFEEDFFGYICLILLYCKSGDLTPIAVLVSFWCSRKRPDNGLISRNMLPVMSCLICCVWLILRNYTLNYICRNTVICHKEPILKHCTAHFTMTYEACSKKDRTF